MERGHLLLTRGKQFRFRADTIPVAVLYVPEV